MGCFHSGCIFLLRASSYPSNSKWKRCLKTWFVVFRGNFTSSKHQNIMWSRHDSALPWQRPAFCWSSTFCSWHGPSRRMQDTWEGSRERSKNDPRVWKIWAAGRMEKSFLRKLKTRDNKSCNIIFLLWRGTKKFVLLLKKEKEEISSSCSRTDWGNTG